MTSRIGHTLRCGVGLGVATVGLFLAAPGSSAQEVVQALPPAGSVDLSNALQRLASDGNDLSALLDAGDAALRLGDVSAAIGFFGRAQALSPSNARVALGLGRAYTLSRRPVEALRLFAEAEAAGMSLTAMAAERGLAFDLVGDSESARELYELVLGTGPNPAVRRNLALNRAIAGDKEAFEAVLLPLLQNGDTAAFRTRAFGLAILGDTEAAVRIARDMMGPNAVRIEPYLRYMTQLTPAQQAAAGALGVFPRSGAVGRDDAQIAAYTPSPRPSADEALAPAGAPLGNQRTQERPRNQRISRRNERADRLAATRGERQMARATTRPARPVATDVSPASTPTTQEVQTSELPAIGPPATGEPATQTVVRAEATRPVDSGVPVASTQSSPSQNLPPPPHSSPQRNLEDAFAGFTMPTRNADTPRAGAVDITTIDAPRESDTAIQTTPAPPSRHWVQLATGRDLSALAFDWRRLTRAANGALAGKSAFVASWGEANRLLAGPYDSAADAQAVVARLRQTGMDSFAFTSAQGERVTPLAGTDPAPGATEALPAHPARYWVQIATGRDRSALSFDWRRIARGAEGLLDGKGPFVAEWGQTSRLLAGPFDSDADARVMVNRLKALQIDSFTFGSNEGEVIDALG